MEQQTIDKLKELLERVAYLSFALPTGQQLTDSIKKALEREAA